MKLFPLLLLLSLSCACAKSNSWTHEDLLLLCPSDETTKVGLHRIDFFAVDPDFGYVPESWPCFVNYFSDSDHPARPLDQIHIGMSVQQVIDVLGDPQLDDRDNTGSIWYRIGFKTIIIDIDDHQLVSGIEPE